MPDVIIIGSGAGGGPLAFALSKAGCDVVVLEKGPRYDRTDYLHDEVAMGRRSSFFVPRLEDEPHVFCEQGGENESPRSTRLGWSACCVGGGTAHYGAALYRFHPIDFQMRTAFGEFESIEDWPYSYDALEPYYTRAEWEIGVSGGDLSSRFSVPRSRPYPMTPLRCHPLAARIDTACQQLGIRVFPTPRAINSRQYGGRPSCCYCTYCAGFGCPIGARGSTQETFLARAQQSGRCIVRPKLMVSAITIDSQCRATGCLCFDEALGEHLLRAPIICVCCSAIESARLLLISKSSRFPEGLANDSGLVGKHLQFHCSSIARCPFREDVLTDEHRRNRVSFLGRSVMDYYLVDDQFAGLGKGGLLRFDLSEQHVVADAQRLAEGDETGPLWGMELKSALRDYFCRTREAELEVFHDFIPNVQTSLELDPIVRDKWNLPVARIYLHSPSHQLRAGQWLLDRGLEILNRAGTAEAVSSAVATVSTIMSHGTCRAGYDPNTSVLNAFCQSHAVPNLFVVDGSFMPTSGGAPSTLTIMANSLRVADYIIAHARRGGFGANPST